MPQIEWLEPEYRYNNLRLKETKDGILISQDGGEYLAEKWRLSPPVVEVINLAVNSGFYHLIQDRHFKKVPPKDKNDEPKQAIRKRPDISFSPGKKDGQWIFCLDASSSPPRSKDRSDIVKVTFGKKMKEYLTSHGVKIEPEKGGGQNFFVKRADLEKAIEAVKNNIGVVPEGERPPPKMQPPGHYLPTKKDFLTAMDQIPHDAPTRDEILDQIEKNLLAEGKTLKKNWRMITKMNIEIWANNK